jgi:two-component system KDP operon response regulator KdpE
LIIVHITNSLYARLVSACRAANCWSRRALLSCRLSFDIALRFEENTCEMTTVKDVDERGAAPADRRILVVDDEPQITRVLRTMLSTQGYTVHTAGDGDEALEVMRSWQPDLLITDLAMPNLAGIELCRRVRLRLPIPIIVLSVKGEERTKIEALDAGADDYVTKPFAPNELLARIRALLRRAGMPPVTREVRKIEVGDFSIDLDTRRILVRGGEVRLSPKEFDLLVYWASHPSKVVTHRTLLSAVWEDTPSAQPDHLRVFVTHLRKKLEPEDGSVRYIITEPWVGYRFEPGD